MRREIDKTTYGGAPGKPEWRSELAGELREIYRIVADEVIEFGVGLPHMTYASAGYKFVRAMLVAYGSGSEAGGEPIRTRPGEQVWDSDLRERGLSKAQSSYLLPNAFNQEGNDFIENAMRIMQTHFKDTLERIWAGLPNSAVYSNVRVVSR